MKIGNLGTQFLIFSMLSFLIKSLALCISSAVFNASTHKVISQVSLGVGLSTAGGSTWLSLPLLPSDPVESCPRSSCRCLKGISREDDCDRHYYKGNSQKLCARILIGVYSK